MGDKEKGGGRLAFVMWHTFRDKEKKRGGVGVKAGRTGLLMGLFWFALATSTVRAESCSDWPGGMCGS